jgi:hypothetical protein
MQFNLLELSKFRGSPIGLLRIARGSVVLLYTSASRPITVGADTYQPLAISRSAIRDSTERRKNTLTITMPIGAECTAWWRPYPPSTRVDVTWLSMHWGDDEVVVEWTGRVIAPKFNDSELELNCEPSKSNSRSRGRFLRWQKGCTFALYDMDTCGVDKALHALPATLSSIDGVELVSSDFTSLPDGRLAGGFATWTRTDGEPEFRSIMAHTGDTIILQYGADDSLDDATDFTVYPGCKRSKADCRDYFDNADNFGGCENMPIRSPFDGNLP